MIIIKNYYHFLFDEIQAYFLPRRRLVFLIRRFFRLRELRLVLRSFPPNITQPVPVFLSALFLILIGHQC
jgi:hypothetical protein